ncbi:hypothetical protein QE391_003159 [Pseudomonas fluorescens]|nr:hypothetical protein [Pseudomonas fluorescens]
MMRSWLQILPVFVYKRIARRWASRLTIGNAKFAEPARDILIRINDHDQ